VPDSASLLDVRLMPTWSRRSGGDRRRRARQSAFAEGGAACHGWRSDSQPAWSGCRQFATARRFGFLCPPVSWASGEELVQRCQHPLHRTAGPGASAGVDGRVRSFPPGMGRRRPPSGARLPGRGCPSPSAGPASHDPTRSLWEVIVPREPERAAARARALAARSGPPALCLSTQRSACRVAPTIAPLWHAWPAGARRFCWIRSWALASSSASAACSAPTPA